MPFSGSGVYSLPQPAFVTNTTISSAAVNSNFSDIASALTTTYQAALNLAATQSQGNCQLTRSAASTLKLSPFNGISILISGTVRTLPSGGVTLSLSGLTASTLYYVYAFWSGSIITLETSTTGHVTDTTYGNEVKSGDSSRSLVGMFFSTSTTDTADTSSQRYLASWFNPPMRLLQGSSMTSVTTSSSTIVELSPSTSTFRVNFVQFATRPGEVQFQGYVTNTNVSVYTNTNIGIDSATAVSDEQTWNTDNPVVSGPFNVYLPLSSSVLTEGKHYVAPLGYVTTTGPGSWTGTVKGWLL